MTDTIADVSYARPVLIATPPLAATLLLWLTFAPQVPPREVFFAYGLLLYPWWAWLEWKKHPRSVVPLFAILAAMHWIYFGLPLFLSDRIANGKFVRVLAEPVIAAAAAMAVVGVAALWVGMKLGVRFVRRPSLPDITPGRHSRNYLRAWVILGSILAGQTNAYVFGEGGRQILLILQTIVPATAFTMLYRQWLNGTAETTDKVLMAVYGGSLLVFGLSSGWAGSAIFVGILCGIAYLAERRRAPWAAILMVIPGMMFLQAGKDAFRQTYWKSNAIGGLEERVSFWMGESYGRWSAALTGHDSGAARSLANQTLGRVSLLTQAANVLELTPSTVPYQHGRTYMYILVTLIPRFVWPNKPSVSEANRFYQVAYGLSSERDLDNVSIAVGFLTEAFINFGWPGVVIVMFAVGLLLGAFEKTFFSPESGQLFSCLGIVLLVSLLAIESQLAQYVAGLAQRILLTLIVMLPVTRRRPRTQGAKIPAFAVAR